MSFALIRAPIRRAVASAAPRTAVRSSFRRFSSNAPPPPKSSSNTALYTSLGVLALATGAYYYYVLSPAGVDATTAAKSAIQSAKAAAKFTPSKEDYQKARTITCHYTNQHTDTVLQVYNRIAEIIDDAGSYDGKPSALLQPEAGLMMDRF